MGEEGEDGVEGVGKEAKGEGGPSREAGRQADMSTYGCVVSL